MARTFLTAKQEQYLETLYELSDEAPNDVGIVRLARTLGVARSTAVAAVAQLQRRGIVEKEPYGKIRLTARGVEHARHLQRTEDALFAFLTDLLGVDPATARQEACMLEHSLQEDTRRRLVRFVKRHGKR